jgi:prevent-host-death family protein
MKQMYTVAEAQAKLPGLCRTGRRFMISRRGKPVYVIIPFEDYDALNETIELLSDPVAMKTLRAAKRDKLAYKELNLADENFAL